MKHIFIKLFFLGLIIWSINYIFFGNQKNDARWATEIFSVNSPNEKESSKKSTNTLSPPPQIGITESSNTHEYLSDFEYLLDEGILQKSKPANKNKKGLTAKGYLKWQAVLPRIFSRPFGSSTDSEDDKHPFVKYTIGEVNKTDGNKTDGNKTDGNKTDGNKTDGNKTDVQMDELYKGDITSKAPSKGHQSFNKKITSNWVAHNNDRYIT